MLLPKSTNVAYYLSTAQAFLTTLLFIFSSICVFAQPINQSISSLDQLQIREVDFNDNNRPISITDIYPDSLGILWMSGYSGLYAFDGYTRTHWNFDPNDSLSLKVNQVNQIFEVSHDKWLIGTQNGLHFFDRRTNQFRAYNDPRYYSIGKIYVNALIAFGDSIIAFTNNSLHHIDVSNLSEIEINLIQLIDSSIYATHNFKEGFFFASRNGCYFRPKLNGETEKLLELGKEEIISDIMLEDSLSLWMLGRNSIYKFDLLSKSFTKYPLFDDQRLLVQARMHNCANYIIVKATDRILFVDKLSGEVHKTLHLQHQDDLFTASTYVEEDKTLWIGSLEGRLFYIDLNPAKFHNTTFNDQQKSYVANCLPQLFEVDTGKLLIMLKDGFSIADIYRDTTYLFPEVPPYNYEGWNKNIHCFARAGDSIWIGSRYGIILYDQTKNDFLPLDDWPELAALHESPRSLMVDSRGNLWIATWSRGLYLQDFTNKKLHRFDNLETDIYRGRFAGRFLYEDSKNNIWIGSRGGLFKYDYQQDTFHHYQHDPNISGTMCNNTAFCIQEDTLGNIWIGSYGGGLEKLDIETGSFECFTISDGLLDNNIFSILVDNAKNFWLSSYKGLTKFNPYTHKLLNFTHENGLLNEGYDAFMYGSSPFTGHFFFGGNKGIDYFHPDSIKPSDFKPLVIFTDFKLFNESVPIFREGMPDDQFSLKEHIQFTSEITLSHAQNVFTFDFAAIEYNFPKNNHYAYRMEGFENEWQFVGENRSATYTNLDPGDYTFMVKATNSDGIWNENHSSIALQILPPWWKTWWAYMLYLVGISSVLALIYVFQKRRWRLESQLALQEQEAQRLLELDTFKSNLYSNITHEFRTPLTVISGTVDLMEKNPAQWLATGASTIRRYSAQLLSMINQILDLQKIESARMEVYLRQTEVVSLTRFVIEPFEFAARNKDLELEYIAHPNEVWMDLDVDKYATILSNLLSNAVKFTDKGKVLVSLWRSSDEIRIEVSDTGSGISEKAQAQIFDRFYQEDSTTVRKQEGTGIGLAICKKLLELLSGQIEVSSSMGKGTKFTVTLPITNQAERAFWQHPSWTNPIQDVPIPLIAESPNKGTQTQHDSYQLLVIEDNRDVRTYLQAILAPYYKVLTASNGEEGLKICIEQIPDLVVTDIMMPMMDGFELIEQLQAHDLTTHIPIIALTAKNTDEAKLKTIQRGADAFILKPFDSSQLLSYIRMLIDKRHNLQKAYQNRKEDTALPEDDFTDPILKKVQHLILDNLSDEQVGINQICKKLHISRSQLHNKITALTGFSTSIYLRKIRLTEAKKMLRNPNLQIAEVAYKCGFKDPSYFTRVFKKEFGESPTALQARLTKGA